MNKAFFDTSMFFEPFMKKKRKTGNYGKRALAILKGLTNLKYERVVSASILAECSLLISDPDSLSRYDRDPQEIKEIHGEILKGFTKIGIKREAIILAAEILKEDERVDPLDVLHFACASVEGCKFFFFVDNELKNNQLIKKISGKYGMALAPFDIPKNLD